jgi:hypothetical protein
MKLKGLVTEISPLALKRQQKYPQQCKYYSVFLKFFKIRIIQIEGFLKEN